MPSSGGGEDLHSRRGSSVGADGVDVVVGVDRDVEDADGGVAGVDAGAAGESSCGGVVGEGLSAPPVPSEATRKSPLGANFGETEGTMVPPSAAPLKPGSCRRT